MLRWAVNEVLKPGGMFLFYEHVESSLPDVAWWQAFWSPIWSLTLDGCKMNCPSHKLVAKMGCWEVEEVWDIPGEVDHYFPHKSGRYIKKTVAY